MNQEVEKTERSLADRVKDFLFHRSRSYCLVFDPKNVHTEKVLTDLARFCRADKSTFHADPRLHAVMEGRREVWLRIQHHLKLSPDELMKIYARKDIE